MMGWMPYAMFHERFLEIGRRETRTIMVTSWAGIDLPPGEYPFMERLLSRRMNGAICGDCK